MRSTTWVLIGCCLAVAMSDLQAGSTPLFSDNNGNLMEDGQLVFEWDYANRLRRVSRKADGLTLAEYSYDARNRRVRKVVVSAGPAGETTDFGYDGWHAIEERNDGDLTEQQFVYGGRIDEVLAMNRDHDADGDTTGPADARSLFHHDAQGSIFALTDDGAQVTEGYQYDAYGAPTVWGVGLNGTVDFGLDDDVVVNGPGLTGNPYLFQARRLDSEGGTPGVSAGLYYYRNRHLHSTLGRFLQRDPLWDPANFENLYAFVSNNPQARSDPLGTLTTEEISAAHSVVVAQQQVWLGIEGSTSSGHPLHATAQMMFHDLEEIRKDLETMSADDTNAIMLAAMVFAGKGLRFGFGLGFQGNSDAVQDWILDGMQDDTSDAAEFCPWTQYRVYISLEGGETITGYPPASGSWDEDRVHWSETDADHDRVIAGPDSDVRPRPQTPLVEE